MLVSAFLECQPLLSHQVLELLASVSHVERYVVSQHLLSLLQIQAVRRRLNGLLHLAQVGEHIFHVIHRRVRSFAGFHR